MSKHRMPPAARKAIGRRLRVARESLALTQAQAARKLGLKVTTTLANYEQGRTEIPLRLLPVLTEVYRIQVEALLFGEPRAEVVDLETRRRYRRIQQQGQELIHELGRLVARLETLFKPNDEKKRSHNG